MHVNLWKVHIVRALIKISLLKKKADLAHQKDTFITLLCRYLEDRF